MVKQLKGYLKSDLLTITSNVVTELAGWENVQKFPAISVFPLGIKTVISGEGVANNVLRMGLGLYVKKSSSLDVIADKLDDLYESLLDCSWENTRDHIEALEVKELIYDAYNNKEKGTAYVPIEISFIY